MTYATILALIDGRPGCESVMKAALGLGERFQALVELLHVEARSLQPRSQLSLEGSHDPVLSGARHGQESHHAEDDRQAASVWSRGACRSACGGHHVSSLQDRAVERARERSPGATRTPILPARPTGCPTPSEWAGGNPTMDASTR